MFNFGLSFNAMKHEGPLVFVRSKPLISPNYSFLDEHPQVRIRLNDPIRKVPNLTQLLAWCVYADAIIKIYKSNYTQDQRKDSAFADIARTCYLISPSELAVDVLQNLNILAHVPAVQQVFQSPNAQMERYKRGSSESYFSFMSDLNQLLVMNGQLHQDVPQPHNHKYIAHQLALLHASDTNSSTTKPNLTKQCLTQVQGETLPFRRQIEKAFNGIKHLTEETDPRQLNQLSKEWLQELTEGVHSAVRSLPPQLYAHIKTFCELTKRLHSTEAHHRVPLNGSGLNR